MFLGAHKAGLILSSECSSFCYLFVNNLKKDKKWRVVVALLLVSPTCQDRGTGLK